MKIVRYAFLLIFLSLALQASNIIGSWEVDVQKSLKNNDKTFAFFIENIVTDLPFFELKEKGVLVTDKKVKSKWKKIDKKEYLFNLFGEDYMAKLQNKTNLKIIFEMPKNKKLYLFYAPKGSVKKVKSEIPKEFPYFGEVYRSQRQIEGKHTFIKISKDGKVYNYEGSSKTAPKASELTQEMAKYSGKNDKLILNAAQGNIKILKDKKTLTLHFHGTSSDYILASYKDPSIKSASSTKLPWTKKEVKEYILKTPNAVYEKIGVDPFEKIIINKKVSFKVEVYEDRYKMSEDGNGFLYEWSVYSPFVSYSNAMDTFKYEIVGEQSVKTKAGTFDCVIVYVYADSANYKVWMVKDRPGVYAKYLDDYFEYTLVEIN
ncbi:MAG: hypothetical protein PF437_09445 [Sulfurimonas sp.]|nr:hypothetical protein [Sulfurimonas sp.]